MSGEQGQGGELHRHLASPVRLPNHCILKLFRHFLKKKQQQQKNPTCLNGEAGEPICNSALVRQNPAASKGSIAFL